LTDRHAFNAQNTFLAILGGEKGIAKTTAATTQDSRPAWKAAARETENVLEKGPLN